MHKIDTPSADDGQFVDKNSSLGIDGTVVDASWLNSVQDEICNLIESAGMALDKHSVVQLRDAVAEMIYSKTKKVVVNASSVLETISSTQLRVSESFKIEQGCTIDFTSSIKIVTGSGSGHLSFTIKNASSGNEYSISQAADASSGTVFNDRSVFKVGNGGATIPDGTYYVVLNAVGTSFPSDYMFKCDGIISNGQA